jgi:hypothetical protein
MEAEIIYTEAGAWNHASFEEMSVYRSHSNKNGKNYIKFLIAKQIQHNDVHLDCISHHVLHAPYNVPLRHKCLGIKSFFFFLAVSTRHATPPSPFTSSWDLKWRPRPHTASFIDQKGWRSLGAKSGEYGGQRNTSKFRINLHSASQ